jgi:hypothetical protein
LAKIFSPFLATETRSLPYFTWNTSRSTTIVISFCPRQSGAMQNRIVYHRVQDNR